MTYALESTIETNRLEKQSEAQSYDFKKELLRVENLDGKIVCDAGCGSGIVSRYLASRFPTSQIIACDASDIRIQQSKKLSSAFPNISFQVQDIKKLTLKKESIDFLFSRLVIEHFAEKEQKKVISEFHRCVKPGGQICLIDLDGIYLNVHPIPREIRAGLQKLSQEKPVDLFVGRKLPHLMVQAGFINVSWKVQTLAFSGESLLKEKELIAERFQAGVHFFTKVLGSTSAFSAFKGAYLDLLSRPGTTLFYSKWICWGTK